MIVTCSENGIVIENLLIATRVIIVHLVFTVMDVIVIRVITKVHMTDTMITGAKVLVIGMIANDRAIGKGDEAEKGWFL